MALIEGFLERPYPPGITSIIRRVDRLKLAMSNSLEDDLLGKVTRKVAQAEQGRVSISTAAQELVGNSNDLKLTIATERTLTEMGKTVPFLHTDTTDTGIPVIGMPIDEASAVTAFLDESTRIPQNNTLTLQEKEALTLKIPAVPSRVDLAIDSLRRIMYHSYPDNFHPDDEVVRKYHTGSSETTSSSEMVDRALNIGSHQPYHRLSFSMYD